MQMKIKWLAKCQMRRRKRKGERKVQNTSTRTAPGSRRNCLAKQIFWRAELHSGHSFRTNIPLGSEANVDQLRFPGPDSPSAVWDLGGPEPPRDCGFFSRLVWMKYLGVSPHCASGSRSHSSGHCNGFLGFAYQHDPPSCPPPRLPKQKHLEKIKPPPPPPYRYAHPQWDILRLLDTS